MCVSLLLSRIGALTCSVCLQEHGTEPQYGLTKEGEEQAKQAG